MAGVALPRPRHEGGGISDKGEGALKEHYYSPSPGGRGLGGGGEKWDFLYYQAISWLKSS